MPVHMQSHVRRVIFDQARLDRQAREILSHVGEASAELGILFVGDQRMRSLNRRYRGKDRTTDVLAFAMRDVRPGQGPGARGKGQEVRVEVSGMSRAVRAKLLRPLASRPAPELLGDVVISIPTATRQARQGGRSLDEELACLLVHGILHLCGYDHERSEKEARRMQRRERMILRSLGSLPKQTKRTSHE